MSPLGDRAHSTVDTGLLTLDSGRTGHSRLCQRYTVAAVFVDGIDSLTIGNPS
jgi:hypothetical protein